MESFKVVPPRLSAKRHCELIASEKIRHNSTIVFFLVDFKNFIFVSEYFLAKPLNVTREAGEGKEGRNYYVVSAAGSQLELTD